MGSPKDSTIQTMIRTHGTNGAIRRLSSVKERGYFRVPIASALVSAQA